ncbi:MAG TPA: M56 family metallopeptidase [Ruminiclostridium sp.]
MKLNEIFFYVVSLSLMGSILAIGLLIIKSLFRQKLGANWHYYIWIVLILRLMVPFTPSTPISVLNLIPGYHHVIDLTKPPTTSINGINSASVIQSNDNISETPTEASNSIQNAQQPQVSSARVWFNWQTASLVWIIGVSAIFLYIVLINGLLFFKTKKLKLCESEDILRILQECKSILKICSEVYIVYDTTTKSPSIFGLFHPKIIISHEIVEKLSDEELSYIFLHELSHLKRGDLLVNGLVLAIQAVYWFNPIVWYGLHRMKQECEIACDANALAALKPEEHKKYGQTIINMLQLLSDSRWVPGTLGFANKFNTRRIIMISKFKKTTITWAAAAISLTLLVGCASLNAPLSQSTQNSNTTNSLQNSDSTSISTPSSATNSLQDAAPSPAEPSTIANSIAIVYKSAKYGFDFSLPKDWKGYSIVNSQWEGLAADAEAGQKVVQRGPMISIRSPKWTSKTPTQDIPIMVFTIIQWNLLQQEVFHIGAAPVGPSELGRNNSYVFALPARYNFAFPVGYEEVEMILKGKPLTTTQVSQQQSDPAESLISIIYSYGKSGKIINSDFLVKANTIQDVEKVWGKADKTDWVAAAKGNYATYNSHNVVFGFNKGDQIFEIRSFDSRLKGITINKVKEILGAPAHDVKSNGQEIIGYITSSEFKVEMVFPQPTKTHPNPVLDHYNVFYPQGTVNNMGNDPGRQW